MNQNSRENLPAVFLTVITVKITKIRFLSVITVENTKIKLFIGYN